MESKTTTGVADKTGVGVLKAHLALYVSDVERSIEFYRGMLGIEPAKVRRGYAKFDVVEPPLNLTLNQNPAAAGRGAVSHLGIQVATTDDVLAMRRRWHAAGLVTKDEMQTDCCYALQDKTWVKDPDGYEWEAFVVLEDNLAEMSAPTLCCVPEAEGSTATEAASCATEAATTCATGTTGAESSQVVSTAAVASCCAPAPAAINR